MNFSNKISDLEENHLLRSRRIAKSPQGTVMKIDNQDVVNFCSNDYLSLANHAKIKEALIEANQAWYLAKEKGSDKNIDHFLSELGWREFSYCQLYLRYF